MVTHEEGSDADLRALVSHAALLELMLRTIDRQKSARGFASQVKSKVKAGKAKEKARQRLFKWLDRNIGRFSGKLDDCAAAAADEITRLGHGEDWVRKQISAYRKEKVSGDTTN